MLIRVDFNVPQDKTLKITDNTRIKAALPTIMKVVEGGGKAVLMSHLGRPKGKWVAELTLASLVEEVAFLTGRKVHFAKDCIGDQAQVAISMASFGEIVLLENLRYYEEETAGDQSFAASLSKLGDIYLNDAFGTAHRAPGSDISVVNKNEVKRNNDKNIKILLEHADIEPNISISDCKFQSHEESRDEPHINYAEDVYVLFYCRSGSA